MLTVVGIIVGILFGVIAYIQTRRANKFAKQVAVLQGTFKKPNIKIRLYNREDVESFFLALPLSQEKVLEVPLMQEEKE
jgi:hypothetical protein